MPALADLLLHTADGAFAVDALRRVTHWNPACEELLGVPARKALGRPCQEVVQACDDSGNRFCQPDCHLAQLVRGGAAPKTELLSFAPRNGTLRRLWLSVFLIPSQWKDLWTVVHLLQREAPAVLPLVPAQPPVGKRRGGPGDQERQAGANSASLSALTAREREILRLLAQGRPTAVISRQLSISTVTVRNHIQHLMAKLGLHSQLEVVAHAYRNNLVAVAPGRESIPCFAGEGA